MENQTKENQIKIQDIKNCIGKLSEVVECDFSQKSALLGSQGITESNMFVYMGMVE